MRHLAVAVAALVGIASPALAQPGPEPEEPEIDGPKSGGAAVALSLGATLATFAIAPSSPTLGMVGLIVAPSAGRWYNHEVGGIGMAARATGIVLALRGITQLDTGGCEGWYTAAECDAVEAQERRGERMLYAGIGIWVAATLYDFAEAGRGAQRYNRRVQVTPVVTPQQTGIAVAGSF